MSKSINETKKQIDQLRKLVEEKSTKRQELTGDLLTDKGQLVMNEDEYFALVELKKVLDYQHNNVIILSTYRWSSNIVHSMIIWQP